MRRHIVGIVVWGWLIGLVGCAATPVNQPDMSELRADYAAIAAIPDVRRHAPVALHDAERAIERAAAASDRSEYTHQVYRAKRLMQIALAVTGRELAALEVQALSRERDRLRLSARERESQRATARARDLQAELAALETQRTDSGVKITLQDVMFETNRAALLGGVGPTLDALADFLREHPERTIIVEGHTDSRGSDDFNWVLSERRAEEVKDAIVARGIPPERILARGYGETRPLASNDTVAGRQLNRRVDIVILRDGLQPPEAPPE